MVFKIIVVGLSGVIISIILKQIKPEFCLIFNVCVGLVIFTMIIDGVKEIIESLNYMQGIANVKMDIVSPILKVVGVGYITEFAADLSEESGNKSIAGKILLGGKIAICALALPILKELLNVIFSLI